LKTLSGTTPRPLVLQIERAAANPADPLSNFSPGDCSRKNPHPGHRALLVPTMR